MTPETRTIRLAEIGETAVKLHGARVALAISERDGAKEQARNLRRDIGLYEQAISDLIDKFTAHQ